MGVEELKKKTILVQYVCIDTIPKEGFKRMQYYTSLKNESEKYYFGLSVRGLCSEEKNTLERWVKEGKLVKLTEPKVMKFENDVWLDEGGNIIFALGYEPWKGKKEIIGSISKIQ